MDRIEINVQTGEQSIIKLSPEEVSEALATHAKWETEQAKIEAKRQAQISAKQAALDKLVALGLTQEEAIALSATDAPSAGA